MLINFFVFAITLSLDSLGVGITYGVRNINIAINSKLILFFISFFITLLSTCIGVVLLRILPSWFPNILGCILLTCMGGFGILKDPSISDVDNSKIIDSKESILLGLAMSADSLVCGIGFSMVDYFSILFPLLVAMFQLLFLSIGIIMGKKIKSISSISPAIWSRISGILLILLGLFKLIG